MHMHYFNVECEYEMGLITFLSPYTQIKPTYLQYPLGMGMGYGHEYGYCLVIPSEYEYGYEF